jgi:hypothetical protein
MNPADPLTRLHPLREPEMIGWWPPAPGWWLLLAIALVLVLGILVMLWRRYRGNAYRRQARAQLSELYAAYNETGDTAAFAAATNALLKSVALQVFPREQVAACSGPAWLALLNDSVPGAHCFTDDFSAAVYRGDAATLDAAALHAAAGQWIARHRVNA